MSLPRFDRSAETEILIHFIELMPESEVFCYGRFSAAIGMDVTEDRGRNLLRSARDIAEREAKIFLRAGKTEAGELGLYRCSPADYAGYAPRGIRDLRRRSRRHVKRLSFADPARLDKDERLEIGKAATIAGVIMAATSEKAQRVVARELSSAEKERLTSEETMRRLLQRRDEVG